MKKKPENDSHNEPDPRYSTKFRHFDLQVPANLRVLCALLEVTPERLLNDFMQAVSYSFSSATTEQSQAAVGYFLQREYGQHLYGPEQIRRMFRELEARQLLRIDNYPDHERYFDVHCRWSNMYIQYWFKKWFYRVQRRKSMKALEEY